MRVDREECPFREDGFFLRQMISSTATFPRRPHPVATLTNRDAAPSLTRTPSSGSDWLKDPKKGGDDRTTNGGRCDLKTKTKDEVKWETITRVRTV